MEEKKVTDEQIEILEKLMDMEIHGDDPCLDDESKEDILQILKETHEIPQGIWYEMMEMGGYVSRLTGKEQTIIAPIYKGAERTLIKDMMAEKERVENKK